MRLRPEEEISLNHILAPIKNDKRVQNMKKYIQHGRITTFDHVESVTRLSYWINRRFHIGADERVLTIGAFLHDYYLYDWHDARLFVNVFKMHGFTHPEKARENAVRDFAVDEKVQKVIRCHMWPLTFRSFPSSREAFIVCMADKICALKETVARW